MQLQLTAQREGATSVLSAAHTDNAKSAAATSSWHQHRKQLLTASYHWSGRPTLSYAMEKRGAWKCSYGYHFHDDGNVHDCFVASASAM